MRSKPAVLDTFKNSKIVNKTKISIITKTAKAIPILWYIKNSGLQHKFRANCVKNIIYPQILFSELFLTEYKTNEIKIVIYKIVHAGANTAAGGVRGG